MALDARQKMQRYRSKMRAAGLRPVQIWVPDTRQAGFAEECRRQSLSLRSDPHEREIVDRLAAIADTEDWK